MGQSCITLAFLPQAFKANASQQSQTATAPLEVVTPPSVWRRLNHGTRLVLRHTLKLMLAIERAKQMEERMLRFALAFFVLALVSMLFGAYGIAGMSMEVGRILLLAFLVLAGIAVLAALFSGRRPNIPS